MSEPLAQRTLVKSPPELWAEVSDASTLARHLGEFGEIRITRLEPETTVVWEGDRACGTVALEPSGWGTKVTLTAELSPPGEPPAPTAEPVEQPPAPVAVEPPAPVAVEQPPAPVAEAEAAPEAEAEAAPGAEPVAEPSGFLGRWRARRAAKKAAAGERFLSLPLPSPPAAVEPEPAPEPVAERPEPEPVVVPEPVAEEIVVEAAPAPEPEPLDAAQAQAVLVGVLDTLGAAHHRPFSRG